MALPTAITDLFAPIDGISYCGPFISSAGNVYVVGFKDVTGTGLYGVAVWKATDPTISFTNVATDGTASSLANSITAHQVDDTLHIAKKVLNELDYYTFNMATDTLSLPALTASPAGTPSMVGVALAKRNTGNDVIMLQNVGGVTTMGKTYGRVAAVRIAGGTSIGAYTQVGSILLTGTTAQSESVESVVLGTSDRVHLFWSTTSSSSGGATTIQHRTVKSTDNLDNTQPATAAQTVNAGGVNNSLPSDDVRVCGKAFCSAAGKLAVPFKASSTGSGTLGMNTATSADSPTWSSVGVSSSVVHSGAIGAAEVSSKIHGAPFDGTDLYAVWEDSGFQSHYDVDTGSGFGTDAGLPGDSGGGLNDQALGVNIYQRSSDIVLAVLQTDSFTAKYYEVVLRTVSSTKNFTAKMATSSSAKATQVNRARKLTAKAATASSMKATLKVTRPVTAKLPTATSAKVTNLGKLKALTAKMAIATSAKATRVNRSAKLTAKAVTSNSAKATTAVRVRRVTIKAATANSAKATRLDRTRRLTAKAATASSLRASIIEQKRLTARAPTATSMKADITVSRGATQLTVKMATAVSAKATLKRTVPLTAKAPTATSAKATVRRVAALSFKSASANSAKSSPLRRVRTLTAKAAIANSAKAAMRAVRPITAKVATASSAKVTVVRRSVGLGFRAATANSAKATRVNRVRGVTLKLATSNSAKATVLRRARKVTAKAPSSSSAKANVRVARPITTKAATASSAKATLTTQHVGSVALSVKMATAVSAKANVRVTRPVTARMPEATSARASLRKASSFTSKMATSSSCRVIRTNRVRHVASSFASATSMRAQARCTRRLVVRAPSAAGMTAELTIVGEVTEVPGTQVQGGTLLVRERTILEGGRSGKLRWPTRVALDPGRTGKLKR